MHYDWNVGKTTTNEKLDIEETKAFIPLITNEGLLWVVFKLKKQ